LYYFIVDLDLYLLSIDLHNYSALLRITLLYLHLRGEKEPDNFYC